ncbi:MAG: hypothetical protein B5M54_10490 [Candidatus Aminicenantes bacterium 4484_214]|nr:MAG: hypothetical protein B5M54_10490 [Candidatus Aminicenantes bacterium 4484_214]RLE08212.1 MAG: sulfite exporter TauE/SafE family protein [Candidatus Aminicenantes bacterium]
MDNLLLFIFVGFFAQLVDGTLGMAYGVFSNSFLLSLGVPPVMASASVHTAEIFTTGVSGLSHLKFGNVKRQLFLKLLIPGIIGGILGAYILTSIPGKTIKPIIAVYLLIMGVLIIRKSFQMGKHKERETTGNLVPLGLAGGFFDAIGGGGWGPIVTSTLIVKGNNPRFTIGSVNLAEFFVTLSEAITFFAFIKLVHYKVILGLIIGGVAAAPLAAFACRKLPSRLLMVIVGGSIILLSCRNLWLSLF